MISLHNANCFDILPTIPDASVDLVVADLPYGVLRCDWDKKLPLDAFWDEMRRICRPNTSSVIMFGTQPFTSELVLSNREWFKYSAVWQKSRTTGFQFAKQRLLSSHEDILVFSSGVVVTKNRSNRQMTYNPQGVIPIEKPRFRPRDERLQYLGKKMNFKGATQTETNFPRTVLSFKSVHKPIHPTQKPVELLEYLIRTFSNDTDTVLDPTMGVGSTGVATKNVGGRNFIGIEMEEQYYDRAVERLR